MYTERIIESYNNHTLIQMSWTEILYIFLVLFLIIYGTYFIVRRTSGRNVPFNRSLRYATRNAQRFLGGSQFFGFILWTERTCFANQGSGGYYPRSRICLDVFDVPHMSSIVTLECDV